MDRIQSLQVFVAVAEEEGFAAGARRCNLSPPSATRAINGLEAELGARLFTRTTRRLHLTDVGTRYLDDARHILSLMQSADDAARGAASAPVGLLRLTCPNEFGRIYILPILLDFLDLYPQMRAELVLLDRVVNIVEEGFDVALRIGHLPSSTLSAVKVGSVRRVICGAPSYLAKHGTPETPAELPAHRIVAVNAVSSATEWRFGADQQEIVRISPQLCVSTVAAGLDAARAGWGLCRVLSYQAGQDVAAGRLACILEDFEPESMPIHLVHAEGRRAPAKVRSFIDFARDRLRADPVLQALSSGRGCG